MGQTLGSAPLIPCPLLGLDGGCEAGSLNNLQLIVASSSISESLSTPVCQNMNEENLTENRHYDRWLAAQSSWWTATNLLQNCRLLFLIRQFAAQ